MTPMIANKSAGPNACGVVLIAVCVYIVVACTGCMHTLTPPFNPGLAPAPTKPCPVALKLSSDFTNYMFVNGSLVQVFMGPSLKKYAIYVAQSEFGDVQVLDGQSPRDDARLVLVPRVTSLTLNERVAALAVRWDFNDPKTGQTMLSMHLQCEYEPPLTLFAPPIRMFPKVATGVITKLTSTTIQRFDASADIQRLGSLKPATPP